MNGIADLLNETNHRSWPIPLKKWSYYQEWNNAVFLHWKVPVEELTKYTPEDMEIDSIDGEYWISVVAFTMQKMRPRMLPSVAFISDFHEINVRTYLTHDNKTGVYFLDIEAEKWLSANLARAISTLPYQTAKMKRSKDVALNTYTSSNAKSGFIFNTQYSIGEEITNKSALDIWLTERYCLYLNKGNTISQYEIHHKPWKLFQIDFSLLDVQFKIGNISLNRKPDIAHYSTGVQVIAWERVRLI